MPRVTINTALTMTTPDKTPARLASDAPVEIGPAHLADVLKSPGQARRREFASDTEVEAAFHRFEE
jgi:hypothetical protein